MTETYYDRLGITPEADQSEIKQAWQKLVKEKHPDQNDDPNAQQQFIQIKEAYDVLSDPEERKRYDQLGHSQYLADRQHGGTDTGDAYERDRTTRDGTHGQQDTQQADTGATGSRASSDEVDWGAYTRGHEAAKHVWKAGSGPKAETAPPTDTANAGFVERFFAYGALILIPGVLSVLTLGAWINEKPDNPVNFLLGLEPSMTGSIIFSAIAIVATFLLILGAEEILDTERRIWKPY